MKDDERTESRPIRVMIVDDHGIVRLGLKSLLSNLPGIELVAAVADGIQCLEEIPTTNPDVVLMDVRLPGKSGIEVCREIGLGFPEVKVIILTSYDRKEYIQEAVQAGAKGYVLKEINTDKLMDVIAAVMRGEIVFDPSLMNSLLLDINQMTLERKSLNTLTEVELEVLKYLSLGETNKGIATHMHLSEKTIRNYVSIVLNKLNLCNRTEAAAFAFRHHLNE